MKLSRRDAKTCRALSDELGIPVSEVRKAVVSYFDSIVSAARKLPFDNLNRIYSKEAFTEKSFIVNVPYIGRIGPVYSLYIKWRREESKEVQHVPRSKVRQVYAKPLIEEEAIKALSGQKVNSRLLKDRMPRGKFNKVWLIGSDGCRKAARQVIVNDKYK